jgi:hypothetical protein
VSIFDLGLLWELNMRSLGLAIDLAVLDVGEFFGYRSLSTEKYLVDFEEIFGGSV